MFAAITLSLMAGFTAGFAIRARISAKRRKKYLRSATRYRYGRNEWSAVGPQRVRRAF